MRIYTLVVWITLLSVFAMAARISVDTDTWWHLRAGEWIVENQAIPQEDSFSYTRAGETWQYPGWLVEVPMYALYRLGGPGALNVWTAVMVTLTFLFLWHTLNGGPFLRAFVVIFAATVSAVYWAARPYLVTFLLTAVFLWILEAFRWRGKDRLWWLPLLMILWVNSHGGFVVGIILWGVYFTWVLATWLVARYRRSGDSDLAGQLRRMLLIGVLLLGVILVNPSGLSMYLYAFKTVGIGALQDYIQEWQSPNFHLLYIQPFAWMLLVTFGVVGVSRKQLALTDFLLFSGIAYMGLLAGRNVALFALAAAIVLSRHAEPIIAELGESFGVRIFDVGREESAKLHNLNWVLLVLVMLAVVLKTLTVLPQNVNEDAFRKGVPVAAADYLRRLNPPGRLFNSYNWGGYLLWALPEYPVFIDGRTDLYTDEVIDQWLKVMRSDAGWQEVIQEYDINLVLVEKGSSLDRTLASESEWSLIYEDELAVIYQKMVLQNFHTGKLIL